MIKDMMRPAWRLACAATVVVALGVAGCGGGSSSSKTSPAASSALAKQSSASSGIPQGPNAGDRDADNNGGPSDGDGNV
jgi:hypothetical protein